jgi:hypothetical protein
MNNNSNLSVESELAENCMQAQPPVLKSAKKMYTNCVGKLEEKRPLWRSACGWEDITATFGSS